MSWLTDFAGKAEEFLNKIDQNTATVIQEKQKQKLVPTIEDDLNEVLITNDVVLDDQESNSVYHEEDDSAITSVPPLSPTYTFSSSPPPPSFDERKPDGNESAHSDRFEAFAPDFDQLSYKSSSSVSSTYQDLSRGPRITSYEAHGQQQNMDNKKEDSVLRFEISSLNQEMNHLLTRAKKAEKELSDLKSENVKSCSEMRKKVLRIQDLESQVLSLQDAKTIQETESSQKIKALEERLAKAGTVDASNDELKKNKNKLEETIKAMERREKAANESIKALELELNRLRTSMKSLEADREDRNRRLTELSQQMKDARADSVHAHNVHEEYKVKVRKVLLEKEQLIESLRSSTSLPRTDLEYAELEQARKERDLLRDEASALSLELSSALTKVSELETQLDEHTSYIERVKKETKEKLEEMSVKWTESERETDALREDLRYLQDDSTRQKSEYLVTIKEKEVEIESLQTELNQLRKRNGVSVRNTSPSTNGQEDQEDRLKQLGSLLLEKQALLEAVVADKTALVLKVDSIKEEKESLQRALEQTLEERNAEERRSFSGHQAFDTRISKAYGTLDKLSGRITNTLRRYPAARLFVLVYMILLHFWVFLILFQATPDASAKRK